jgi:hypothetical protein
MALRSQRKRENKIIMLQLLEKLFKEKSVEIRPGTFLECAESASLQIYHKNGCTVIAFGSPGVYLRIKNIGLKLLSINRPRVDKVIIGPKSVKVVLDKFMDFEFDRKEIEGMMK